MNEPSYGLERVDWILALLLALRTAQAIPQLASGTAFLRTLRPDAEGVVSSDIGSVFDVSNQWR